MDALATLTVLPAAPVTGAAPATDTAIGASPFAALLAGLVAEAKGGETMAEGAQANSTGQGDGEPTEAAATMAAPPDVSLPLIPLPPPVPPPPAPMPVMVKESAPRSSVVVDSAEPAAPVAQPATELTASPMGDAGSASPDPAKAGSASTTDSAGTMTVPAPAEATESPPGDTKGEADFAKKATGHPPPEAPPVAATAGQITETAPLAVPRPAAGTDARPVSRATGAIRATERNGAPGDETATTSEAREAPRPAAPAGANPPKATPEDQQPPSGAEASATPPAHAAAPADHRHAPPDVAAAQPAPSATPNAPPADAPPPPPRSAAPIPYPARQVAPFAVALALGPDSSISLTLDPGELGRVEVAIERHGGEAHVSLRAEKPETLALLQRDRVELERALSSAGLGGEGRGTTLSFGLGGDGTQDRERREGGGGQAPRREQAPLPSTQERRRIAARGLLDLAV